MKAVKICYRHDTKRRALDELLRLNYTKPNTSAIERRNATARLMNSTQQRKTLAFAKHAVTKLALGWWTATAYNWCRIIRTLRSKIEHPDDSKRYQQRTPAMVVGIAFAPLTQPILLRTQIFSSIGWG